MALDDVMAKIQKAHQGDKAARDQLVMDNMGLVWSIVRRFKGRGYELEDLFQIGSIGLLKAIDKFDLSYDVRFSTYAVPMIAKVKTARESLCGSLGREPTVEEIAGEIGATREEVAVSMEAAAEVESLYKNVGNGEDKSLCLMDKIEDHRECQEELINHMVLEKLISQLGEKDREIIIRRYFRNQTQTQVAISLGISQVQVSRLEKKILKQMREQF